MLTLGDAVPRRGGCSGKLAFCLRPVLGWPSGLWLHREGGFGTGLVKNSSTHWASQFR